MAIEQSISINASPEKVYQVLTSGKEFGAFTGAPAEIDAREGGAFSMFGGQITGCNVELVANKRVVQAWRAGPWPEGSYSIVRFDIAKEGNGTRLTLNHAGFPDGEEGHLDGGWHKMYWEPLKAYLD